MHHLVSLSLIKFLFGEDFMNIKLTLSFATILSLLFASSEFSKNKKQEEFEVSQKKVEKNF